MLLSDQNRFLMEEGTQIFRDLVNDPPIRVYKYQYKRRLLCVFAVGGISPLVRKNRKAKLIIELVDHFVPAFHVAGLPGAEILVYADIVE